MGFLDNVGVWDNTSSKALFFSSQFIGGCLHLFLFLMQTIASIHLQVPPKSWFGLSQLVWFCILNTSDSIWTETSLLRQPSPSASTVQFHYYEGGVCEIYHSAALDPLFLRRYRDLQAWSHSNIHHHLKSTLLIHRQLHHNFFLKSMACKIILHTFKENFLLPPINLDC